MASIRIDMSPLAASGRSWMICGQASAGAVSEACARGSRGHARLREGPGSGLGGTDG